MKLIIDISEEAKRHIDTFKGKFLCGDGCDMISAIQHGTPLDKIRTELYDYITHSPYIKSFMDCCRLRDDVMRIIDQYKEDLNNEVQKRL